MSKIMRALKAAARDAGKPAAERKRYSVLPGDPGYPNYRQALLDGTVPEVRLDGEIVRYAITADEARGLVIAYDRPYRFVGEVLATIEHHGVVGVTLVPR